MIPMMGRLIETFGLSTMKFDTFRKFVAGSAIAALCLISSPGCDDTSGVPPGGISAKDVKRTDAPGEGKDAKPEDPTKVKSIKGKGDMGVGTEK